MKRMNVHAFRRYRSQLQALDDMKGFVSTIQSVLPSIVPAPRPDERCRIFNTPQTFWLFLYQVLMGNLPLDRTVEKAIGWLQPWYSKPISPNTGGYSQARSRFPQKALDQVHEALRGAQRPGADFHGFCVKVVDGTGLLMEDTPENRMAFPPHPSTGKNLGFPALKLLPLFSLATGVVLNWRTGKITESDSALFRQLWPFLSNSDLVLGDRHFCSYGSFAMLLKQGVHSVARLQQSRKHQRVVKILGKGDRLVEWDKPKVRPAWVSEEDWAGFPETLCLREIGYDVAPEGFRTNNITIVTTVLDKQIPAKDWAELFRDRWKAELNLRDIKSTMELEFIRARSPQMVEKEVGFFLLGYNIVRLIMKKASEAQGVPLEKLSFKSTVSAINIWSPKLAGARTKAEYEYWWKELLRVVGYPRLRNRKNRVEPRVRKRRPKNFQLLMGDRHQYKEIRHRSSYKAVA
jgi:hypothetical protein